MRDHITCDVSTCSVCQKQKKQHKKLRKLIGAVTDTMIIRHIHPYKIMSSNSNHGGECSVHRSIVQAQCMS